MYIRLLPLLLLVFPAGSALSAPAPSPNVVVIISDDQGWADYGFMGHPEIRTPTLDRLASRSLLFRHGYVTEPLCRPSLASIATGLYPHQHGVTANDVNGSDQRATRDIPVRAAFHRNPTWIKLLAQNGYAVHQSGKWWEGSWQDGGFTAGMTHGDPGRGGRHGDAGLTIGREGLDPIRTFVDSSIEAGQPFALWYAPFLPHTPHNPPASILDRYQTDGRLPAVARYYAMCEWFDTGCGELLSLLTERNVIDNTLILYVCDNGWTAAVTNRDDPNQQHWKNYALRSKASPYEGGIRTPILVSWPGRVKPEDSPHLAQSIDLFPTIAAACGLPSPAGLPGINLLDPRARAARTTIYGTSHSSHNMTLGDPDHTLQYVWCIQDEWKLLLRRQGEDTTHYRALHQWDRTPAQLFRIREDPHETLNWAERQPNVVADLSRKIETWQRETAGVNRDRTAVPERP